MQNKEKYFEHSNIQLKKNNLFIVVFLLISLIACKEKKNTPDVSGINVAVSFQRVEQDLFNIPTDSFESHVLMIQKKYPDFFPLYIENILRMGKMDDLSERYLMNLKNFLNNKAIRGLYDTCEAKYTKMDDVQNDLITSFKYLKYYFPQTKIPKMYTFISEFSYGVITADNMVGIGLDMFLGENYIYYQSIEFPQYLIRNLKRASIAPNVMKAWIQHEFEKKMTPRNLLGEMIYNGKIFYLMDIVMPELPDSLKIGYTSKHLDWCDNNEGEIWSFFIQNKLLYSTDVTQYNKFVNEGPTTTGMPAGSPGNIASWVGWQIVKKFMKENPAFTPSQLMNENDAQKILQMSKYKPKR